MMPRPRLIWAARGPFSHFESTIAQFYKYLARTLAAIA